MLLDIIAQFWYVWAFFVGFFVVRRRKQKEIPEKKEIMVIGHRGACGYACQNTWESFKKAMEIGVDYLECDVRKSMDGVFYLSHDEIVKTIAGEKVKISQTPSKILKTVKLKKGGFLLTLEDLIKKILTEQKIQLDLKIKGAEFELIDFIRKNNLLERCIITSHHASSLRLLKVLEPKLILGITFPRERFSTFFKTALSPILALIIILIKETYFLYLGWWCSYAKADFITVWYLLLSERTIKSAHKKGIGVFVFAVNRHRHIRKVMRWEVDGIISDYPDRVKEMISGK